MQIWARWRYLRKQSKKFVDNRQAKAESKQDTICESQRSFVLKQGSALQLDCGWIVERVWGITSIRSRIDFKSNIPPDNSDKYYTEDEKLAMDIKVY